MFKRLIVMVVLVSSVSHAGMDFSQLSGGIKNRVDAIIYGIEAIKNEEVREYLEDNKDKGGYYAEAYKIATERLYIPHVSTEEEAIALGLSARNSHQKRVALQNMIWKEVENTKGTTVDSKLYKLYRMAHKISNGKNIKGAGFVSSSVVVR